MRNGSVLRLGVNIDHVATLRNARGGAVPDPVRAAQLAVAAGADGITAHLREDRRHIRDEDISRLRAELRVPLNFEMAATDEMVAIALQTRPHACCLVPEKRERAHHGRRPRRGRRPRPPAARLRRAEGCGRSASRCSSNRLRAPSRLRARSMRPSSSCIRAPGATLSRAARPRAALEFERLRLAAQAAAAAGIECHAGHGLDFATARLIAALPEVVELNIGHFLDRRGGLRRPGGGDRQRMRAPMEAGRAREPDAARGAARGAGRHDRRHRHRPLRHPPRRAIAGAFRRPLRSTLLHRGGAQAVGGEGRARAPPTPSGSRPRRPAPRRSARASARAWRGATWAWSTCRRASRRWR